MGGRQRGPLLQCRPCHGGSGRAGFCRRAHQCPCHGADLQHIPRQATRELEKEEWALTKMRGAAGGREGCMQARYKGIKGVKWGLYQCFWASQTKGRGREGKGRGRRWGESGCRGGEAGAGAKGVGRPGDTAARSNPPRGGAIKVLLLLGRMGSTERGLKAGPGLRMKWRRVRGATK